MDRAGANTLLRGLDLRDRCLDPRGILIDGILRRVASLCSKSVRSASRRARPVFNIVVDALQRVAAEFVVFAVQLLHGAESPLLRPDHRVPFVIELADFLHHLADHLGHGDRAEDGEGGLESGPEAESLC